MRVKSSGVKIEKIRRTLMRVFGFYKSTHWRKCAFRGGAKRELGRSSEGHKKALANKEIQDA